eukprot:NODE_113_length_18482_cov_1.630746.p18 type:complete len:124 gc:universal NODE_113_length_18482_cov_1.630746:10637-10266(-)
MTTHQTQATEAPGITMKILLIQITVALGIRTMMVFKDHVHAIIPEMMLQDQIIDRGLVDIMMRLLPNVDPDIAIPGLTNQDPATPTQVTTIALVVGVDIPPENTSQEVQVTTEAEINYRVQAI